MEIFISYAEYLEDLILYDALKKEESIFWVDIGAFDPIDLSVTKAFSLRGGGGINVEPLDVQFKLLQSDREFEINVQTLISNEDGIVELFEAGGASSVEEKTLKSIKKNNSLIKSSFVKSITMAKLMDEYLPENREVTILKIDVEGHERQVLEGMNFSKNRPKVILIESVVPWKGTPAFEKWEPILLQNDYIFSFGYRNNRYYTDKAFPEIKFRSVNHLLKDYRVFIISSPNDKYRLSYMAIESVFSEHPKIKQTVLALVRLLYPFVSKHFPSLVK